MRRKIRSAVHKLTRRVARALTGLIDRDGPEAPFPNIPGSQPTFNPNPENTPAVPEPSIMADGEEDYSSLPLTDRWVHKVRVGPAIPPGVVYTNTMSPRQGGEGYPLEATIVRTKIER